MTIKDAVTKRIYLQEGRNLVYTKDQSVNWAKTLYLGDVNKKALLRDSLSTAFSAR